jgi:hypothetical protein
MVFYLFLVYELSFLSVYRWLPFSKTIEKGFEHFLPSGFGPIGIVRPIPIYSSRSIAPAATMIGHAESARSAPKSNASIANCM